MWYLLFLIGLGIFVLGWYLGARDERLYGCAAAEVAALREIEEFNRQLEEYNAAESKREHELTSWLDNEIASMRLQNYKI